MQSTEPAETMKSSMIAVVGAGTMGSSIVVALLAAGYSVLLKETDQAFLDKGMANIDRLLSGRVKKGLSPEEAQLQRSRIECVLDFERFAEVDFVIEAAPENIEIKKSIFEQLDQWCNVDAILATNTSSLSITQIANFARRADKVVGLHFFNPAHIMKLVEVIPGLETSHDTVARALELAQSMGKLAIRVEECASFLVNRLLGRYMNESLFTLEGGVVGVEEIDKAVCDYVMPIGPLALRDMNGADIGLAVANFNYQEYGERFAVPALLSRMVEANMLGQKTMSGFYAYDKETRKRSGVNPELLKLLASPKKKAKTASVEFSAERLFLPMINESFLAMQERICQPEDLDAALMAGLGMRRGPLTLASEIGLKDCLAMLEASFKTNSGAVVHERFRPAPLLKRFVWAGRSSVL
ncbi:MAG: 3-hydroxyacyl-CoA dehydrogenase NAD-binding domain-containing protein [Candidatus Obscuribacterales bacterium]|jgi:3-hydroxyacyl-CoA dehydrogenase